MNIYYIQPRWLKDNVIHIPVQNFGSSLKSPQSSLPSQYLSNGKQSAPPRHWNSDILQELPSFAKCINRMMMIRCFKLVVAVVVIIWKEMKKTGKFNNLSWILSYTLNKNKWYCIELPKKKGQLHWGFIVEPFV